MNLIKKLLIVIVMAFILIVTFPFVIIRLFCEIIIDSGACNMGLLTKWYEE